MEKLHEMIPAFSNISNHSWTHWVCFSDNVYGFCAIWGLSPISMPIISNLVWPISLWYSENISLYSLHNLFKTCCFSDFVGYGLDWFSMCIQSCIWTCTFSTCREQCKVMLHFTTFRWHISKFWIPDNPDIGKEFLLKYVELFAPNHVTNWCKSAVPELALPPLSNKSLVTWLAEGFGYLLSHLHEIAAVLSFGILEKI